MAKDYYAVLGLQKGASAEEIKKTYRRLSKELHPDKHKGDKTVEQKFKEVNEAYEVLGDPRKKQMYDQFGEAGVNGQAGGFGGFGRGGFEGFDFSGFGGGGAEGFANIFESFFGGNRARASERQPFDGAQGRDVETEIIIDFAEAVAGVRRDLKLKRLLACDRCKGEGAEPGSKVVTCSECGGAGQVTRTAQSFFGIVRQTTVCPRCRGAGKVPETVCRTCGGEGRVQHAGAVTVHIPAGIHDGQSLRMRGEGEAGRRGAPAGDLYVHVHVRGDGRFARDGDDIRSSVEISALDAMLGTTVDVPTAHGTVALKIPEGTQPDSVLRIRGKGMPIVNSGRTGDHYVTVNVKIPTRLSREERRLLEEWRRARG